MSHIYIYILYSLFILRVTTSIHVGIRRHDLWCKWFHPNRITMHNIKCSQPQRGLVVSSTGPYCFDWKVLAYIILGKLFGRSHASHCTKHCIYMKTICKMWQASHLTLNLDLKFHVYTIHRGCIHFSERETLEPSHCVSVASQQCRAPQDQCSRRQLPWPWMFWGNVVILLMEEIQHQLKGSLSDYFQVFFHLRRCRILPSTVCHCMSLW